MGSPAERRKVAESRDSGGRPHGRAPRRSPKGGTPVRSIPWGMTRARPPSASLLDAPRVREAAATLIDAVRKDLARSFVSPDEYRRLVEEVGALRGRPLQLPILTSGLGARARRAPPRRGPPPPLLGGVPGPRLAAARPRPPSPPRGSGAARAWPPPTGARPSTS